VINLSGKLLSGVAFYPLGSLQMVVGDARIVQGDWHERYLAS
jgi:hypothetical protein